MKSLAFAFIFACYFFCGCGTRPEPVDDTCVGRVATQQAKMIAEECSIYAIHEQMAGYLLVDDCIRKIARQRILIAAEYIKVCK